MALFQALQELQSAEEDLQVWLQQRKPCSFMCSAASLTEEDLSKQTSAAALKGWFDTTVEGKGPSVSGTRRRSENQSLVLLWDWLAARRAINNRIQVWDPAKPPVRSNVSVEEMLAAGTEATAGQTAAPRLDCIIKRKFMTERKRRRSSFT
ncbi:hypothetical protein FQA47_012298 [Oryzias melastigma]|uniref:Uncharacterized protein n=1 Tax=Oryzias melastigma TaxID=30732 RepID=A0A834CHB8_ORYME|nr:hypothetical protein FQA47_012298 [Oryzias melastigma]